MGIAERRQREKEEMRERILEAATEVFIAEGYEKASIRTIADRIEYSPATIYLYFADKDALLFAVHELGFKQLLERFEALSSIEDPFERLHRLGLEYIDFGLNNQQLYDLMFIINAPMDAIGKPESWQMGEKTFFYLLSTVAECLQRKVLRSPSNDPFLVAKMHWAYVHGLVSLYVRNRFKTLVFKEMRWDSAQMEGCCPPPKDDEELRQMLFKAYTTYIETVRV